MASRKAVILRRCEAPSRRTHGAYPIMKLRHSLLGRLAPSLPYCLISLKFSSVRSSREMKQLLSGVALAALDVVAAPVLAQAPMTPSSPAAAPPPAATQAAPAAPTPAPPPSADAPS